MQAKVFIEKVIDMKKLGFFLMGEIKEGKLLPKMKIDLPLPSLQIEKLEENRLGKQEGNAGERIAMKLKCQKEEELQSLVGTLQVFVH